MGAKTATLTWSGQSGSASADGGKYSEQWLVEVEAGDSALVARDTTLLPAFNSRHRDNSQYYCIGRNVVDVKGPVSYIVQVDYQQATTDLSPEDDSPLNEPPRIQISFESTNEPIDRDVDGNPITNTLGDQINPPLTEEFCDMVIRITRNEARFNPQWKTLNNKLNSSTIYDYQTECVLLTIEASNASATVGGQPIKYWQVTYTLKCREPLKDGHGGWVRRFPNMGMRYKVQGYADGNAVNEIVVVKDGQGQVYLNADGGKIRESDAAVGKDIVWLYKHTKQTANFGVLGLPPLA